MKKEQFISVMETTFGNLRNLTATKGEEYSRDADQLANFKRSAVEAEVTTEQVWLVFFNKHIDAVKHYIKCSQWEGKYTSSEPIEGRIDDAILYLLLLKAMIYENQTRIQGQSNLGVDIGEGDTPD